MAAVCAVLTTPPENANSSSLVRLRFEVHLANHFGEMEKKLGNVFSGGRFSRSGKVAVEALPSVRMTHSALYAMNLPDQSYLRIEGPDWATVIRGRRSWPVHLDHTPLHLGGQRRWLLCPACGSRRAVLYIADTMLACRKCLGGRFESQHENRRGRWVRKASRLRVKLGWSPGVLDPKGLRPKGMQATTYRRLCGELNALIDEILGSIHIWVDKADMALNRRDAARSTHQG